MARKLPDKMREHSFTKGGRRPKPRGPNKVTVALKEAIMLAAEDVGEDGRGKDGLRGYLRRVAKKDPKSFSNLLGKIIPHQVTGPDDGPVQVQEVSAREIILSRIASLAERTRSEGGDAGYDGRTIDAAPNRLEVSGPALAGTGGELVDVPDKIISQDPVRLRGRPRR